LDAETGGQKSTQETANACRDREAGTIPANIPVETAYLESVWKPVVRSDWMVVCAVRYEPVSTSNSLLKALLQGIFVKNCLFCEFVPEFCTYNQALTAKFPTN
jgi:hypothetical protein